MPRRYLTATVAALLLAALTLWVTAGGGAPVGPDRALHEWVLRERTAAGVDVFTFITDSGNRVTPHLLAALAGALATSRHWWIGALAGAAALTGGQLVRFILVTALDRPRPPAADWTTHVNNPSLPSGHATTSAMAAIGLTAALSPRCRTAAARALALAVPAAWAVAVGASRVYLGVHWPTDVLAAWLLATVLGCLILPPLARALDHPRGPARSP